MSTLIDATTSTPGADTIPAETPAGSTTDWRSGIPAELRGEKSLESVKDLASLAKGYVEAQKYIGGAVKIPGEQATPEELKSFQQKLGVPEQPAQYNIAKPILPEYVGWDDTVHGKVLEVAHASGLTTKQAAKIVEGLSGLLMQTSPDPNQLLEQNKAALQKDWGENFQRNLILSSRAVDHLASASGLKPDELHAAMAETGAGMHPVILKALTKLGAGLLEQGVIKNEETRLETITDAESKIRSIRSDKAHAYWDASHPEHAHAVDEYRRLLQIIDANKAAA